MDLTIRSVLGPQARAGIAQQQGDYSPRTEAQNRAIKGATSYTEAPVSQFTFSKQGAGLACGYIAINALFLDHLGQFKDLAKLPTFIELLVGGGGQYNSPTKKYTCEYIEALSLELQDKFDPTVSDGFITFSTKITGTDGDFGPLAFRAKDADSALSKSLTKLDEIVQSEGEAGAIVRITGGFSMIRAYKIPNGDIHYTFFDSHGSSTLTSKKIPGATHATFSSKRTIINFLKVYFAQGIAAVSKKDNPHNIDFTFVKFKGESPLVTTPEESGGSKAPTASVLVESKQDNKGIDPALSAPNHARKPKISKAHLPNGCYEIAPETLGMIHRNLDVLVGESNYRLREILEAMQACLSLNQKEAVKDYSLETLQILVKTCTGKNCSNHSEIFLELHKFLANSTFKKIFPDIYNIALALNPHLKEAQAELLIQHPDCKYSNPRRLQVQFQQIFSHKP